ncbi:MAG: 4-hydroxy-3-methylbut-2-enyl diphosphate reductase [Longimicrobiales bacterium]
MLSHEGCRYLSCPKVDRQHARRAQGPVSSPTSGDTNRLQRRAMEQTYFRKGFGLKAEVRPLIDSEYQSALVERIRSRGYNDQFGDVKVRLAKDFGFCYGVDRAVDYAYEARHKFPDKRVYLVGEIIHNPHVNQRLQEMGIEFLYPGDDGKFSFDDVTPEDVVIIPAFGVTKTDFEKLKGLGCVLVDTTCGSVLLVWKRVESYAKDGFTAVIHGKHSHEESKATASQVELHEGGKYIIVRDMAEAEILIDYFTESQDRLTKEAFVDRFAGRTSVGFDPDLDLTKIGVANQTTMLATESLAIGARIREAIVEAKGEDYAEENFRSFGTICSATQERQDAVEEMMAEPPEVMVVIGGYNSSNTNHLAHLCRQHTTTFHIEDASCIDVEKGTIRHKPDLPVEEPELTETDWIPQHPFQLGITAGASTPNNKIGEAVLRVLQIRGIEAEL